MSVVTFRSSDFLKNGDVISVRKDVTADGCGVHDHDFIEFAYVASGKGVHTVDGRSDVIRKGDLFLFATGVSHEYSVEGDEPIVMLNCLFLPEAVNEDIGSAGDFVGIAYRFLSSSFERGDDPKRYIKLSGARTAEAENILEDMLEEYRGGEYGYKQMLRSQLTRLLILAFRLYREGMIPDESAPVLRKLVVENALEYMKAHCALPMTAEQLARRSYLSASYFSRIFREETGMTALKMLRRIRLSKACDLLCSTTLGTALIGSKVGYEDTKHFYRLFKDAYGMTPGEYREKHR